MGMLANRSICTLIVSFLLCCTAWAAEPNVDYSPEDVVLVVVDALKKNRQELGDDGIETVFRFASPNNKLNTGPIDRFKQMIKVGFSNMLNHKATRFGKMQIDENVALQKVWFLSSTGSEHGYLFRLGKQQSGDYEGMWMTDAVYPLKNDKPKGQSI